MFSPLLPDTIIQKTIREESDILSRSNKVVNRKIAESTSRMKLLVMLPLQGNLPGTEREHHREQCSSENVLEVEIVCQRKVRILLHGLKTWDMAVKFAMIRNASFSSMHK